jgi:hypothetical protein
VVRRLPNVYKVPENGIATDKAWRTLDLFKGADENREYHFEIHEVQALLVQARKADPALADFIEGYFHCGARPGDYELTLCNVAHFDARNRCSSS